MKTTEQLREQLTKQGLPIDEATTVADAIGAKILKQAFQDTPRGDKAVDQLIALEPKLLEVIEPPTDPRAESAELVAVLDADEILALRKIREKVAAARARVVSPAPAPADASPARGPGASSRELRPGDDL